VSPASESDCVCINVTRSSLTNFSYFERLIFQTPLIKG
jgi:hypothetical protein